MNTQEKSQTNTVAVKPKTVTVIVTGDNNEKIEGAEVRLSPSEVSGVTNSAGEVELKLGNAPKYDVTVSAEGVEVTVPYYVTNGGATRLMVNPTYVKNAQAPNLKDFPEWFQSGVYISVAAVAILVVVLVIKRIFFGKRR